MSIVFSLVAALFFGTADFAGGYASRRNPVTGVVILSQISGLVLVVAFVLFDRRSTTVGAIDLLLGAGAGLAGLGGLVLLYRGIAKNEIAIVSPAAALLGALVPVLFGLLIGEWLSTTVFLGVAVTLPAIVLISRPGGDPAVAPGSVREAWILGIVSGLFFGLFFVLISVPGEETGMWPLVAARAASITGMIVLALVSRRRIRLHNRLGIVVLAGILDMAANIFLVLAFRSGLVAIASMVVSVYPAQTVFLGWIVLGQRPGPIRLIGIAAALVGIALLSSG